MIAKKRKEITIRKVFGATIAGILLHFSKEYVLLILFAFAISIPVASYFITGWLENFAYRTSINWYLFIKAGLITMLVAWVTISYQSIKIALKNPVDSIRDE